MLSVLFVFQSVIDGDLCEYFNSLDSSKRRSIAEELDRTPAEVKSKLCLLKQDLKWSRDLQVSFSCERSRLFPSKAAVYGSFY